MSKRVLLVDDSPMVHMLLRRTLEKHGFEVCGDAKDGSEAIEMFGSLMPDLVFMDITMPVMDGIEAAKKIKETDITAKIIMLTAMGDDGIISEAMNAGVDIFLKKPFDDYKIIDAISKLL